MPKESVSPNDILTFNNEVQTLDKKQFIQQLLSLNEGGNKESSHAQDVVEPLLSLLSKNADSYSAVIQRNNSASLQSDVLPLIAEESSKFNQLTLFVDELFHYLVDNSGLPQDIRSAIDNLRLPYLMLILDDSNALVKGQHPARLLINDLVKAGLMYDQRDLKTEQIKQQITNTCQQILSIASKQTQLQKVINVAAEQFGQFYQGLVKRAEIFEKRVKEAEEGQAKAESAKQKAKQGLQKILNKQNIPDFVTQMLNNAWQHVLFLEYLKSQKQDNCKALHDAKCLLVSLQPIEGIDGIEKFLELQPTLIENLRSGLEKTTYSFNESSAFFEELDGLHNDLLITAKSTIEKAPKEEILRLKPTLNFGLDEETPPSSLALKPTSFESLNLVEWVDYVFDNLAANPNVSENQEHLVSRQQKERNASEKLIKLLKPGRWLSLKQNKKTIRCKLSTYINSSDKYILVNSSGSKVAEFDSSSMAAAYQDKEIEVIENAPLFERAVKSVLNDLFDKYQQQETVEKSSVDEDEDKEIELPDPPTVLAAVNASTSENSPPEPAANQQGSEATNYGKLSEEDIDNLTNLAVGSWIEIQVGYKMKKCRLAAKIASSGKFLFTDRSGIKVKECFDKELPELYRAGKVRLDEQNTFFDKALATVISNMRNLKSEKH